MYDNPHKFLDHIFDQLQSKNIHIMNWEIDHICYRTSSIENYESTKLHFEKNAVCLIESEVNGRLIATYKLNSPIIYQNYIIDLIEVPQPKPSKVTQEGYEHIEIVIDIDFQKLIKTYPELSFDKKGLLKELNPELVYKFPDCAIKFHHKSLEHIINLEKNISITRFLDNTKILAIFKDYSPCISGTAPLAINNHNSDLDILFSTSNFESFLSLSNHQFENYKKYKIKHTTYQNQESLIISFEYLDLKVELFFQLESVFQQQANQRFLIEGRLIKILGENFKQEIIRLKDLANTTEDAFGEVLKLNNPYTQLLDLLKLTDRQLKNKFRDL